MRDLWEDESSEERKKVEERRSEFRSSEWSREV